MRPKPAPPPTGAELALELADLERELGLTRWALESARKLRAVSALRTGAAKVATLEARKLALSREHIRMPRTPGPTGPRPRSAP